MSEETLTRDEMVQSLKENGWQVEYDQGGAIRLSKDPETEEDSSDGDDLSPLELFIFGFGVGAALAGFLSVIRKRIDGNS